MKKTKEISECAGRRWSEQLATQSEADVKADKDIMTIREMQDESIRRLKPQPDLEDDDEMAYAVDPFIELNS